MDVPSDHIPYLKKAFDGLETGLAGFLQAWGPGRAQEGRRMGRRCIYGLATRSAMLDSTMDRLLINEIKLGSCTSLQNLTISITDGTVGSAVLGLPVGGVNLTIFECPNGNSLPTGFLDQVVGNYSCSKGNRVYIWDGTRTQVEPGLGPVVETPVGCEYVSLPLSGASLQRLRSDRSGADAGGARTLLADVLSYGFQLEWPNITNCQICELTGRRCVKQSVSFVYNCAVMGCCKFGFLRHSEWDLKDCFLY